MIFILIGFLFVALDMLMTVAGNMLLELPPDFLGYLLIGIGARQWRKEEKAFEVTATFSWVGAGVSGFLFLLRLLSNNIAPTSMMVILELAESVLMAVVIFLLITAMRNRERDLELNLYTMVMRWLWIAMITALAVSYIGQLVDLLGSIASLVCDLVMLAIFLLLWNGLQLLKEEKEEQE